MEIAAVHSIPATEMPTVVVAPSIIGHHMHKNCLQEYAQKSGISLPSYSTLMEGPPHVPRFRGTVLIDGMTFTSPNIFSHRKDAEQDVAKLALECISVKFKNEGSHYIRKDPMFCKLILNEYGDKMKIHKPTYNTTQKNGIIPTFITTSYFDGKSYVGFPGKNKKEAEQNAACVIIDYILANSNEGDAMAQIIKTKGKLYGALDHGANVWNAVRVNETESDSANIVNREPELIAISTNESLRSPDCVPSTSWADVVQGNQVNFQIPSLGLPVTDVDSQAISPAKKKKRSKKRKEEQSKKIRVDEPSTSTNPIKDEEED